MVLLSKYVGCTLYYHSYAIATLVCVLFAPPSLLVGHRLATKVFINCWLPEACGWSKGRPMVRGVMGQQNSCMTLIGVHSTMHLMHPIRSCNYRFIGNDLYHNYATLWKSDVPPWPLGHLMGSSYACTWYYKAIHCIMCTSTTIGVFTRTIRDKGVSTQWHIWLVLLSWLNYWYSRLTYHNNGSMAQFSLTKPAPYTCRRESGDLLFCWNAKGWLFIWRQSTVYILWCVFPII